MSGAATALRSPPVERRLPPGPRSGIATGLRWLHNPVNLMEDCRRRYGDHFTLKFPGAGRNVFISDPETIKEVFARDRRGNGMPSSRDLLLKPVMGDRSVLLIEGDEHLRVRKLMLPPFHGERMRAYAQTIEDVAEREVARWQTSRRFALHPSMQAITLEVILSAVFGVVDGARRDELRRRLLAILEVGQSAKAQVLGLALMRLGAKGPFEAFERRLTQADDLLLTEIAERRADPSLSEREDILSLLVAARFDDGSQMSDREIRDQLMTLLLAGHETTATSLAWTFDLLFHHPSSMERLLAELDEGGDDYLGAVCNEALRVRPVIPAVGRRLAERLDLGGYEVGPEDFVNCCIYLVHTREDVYPDAYAFRPERFLDSAPETYTWIPFGGGTRRCIGAAFAGLEMRVVLRTVLRHARLEPANDKPEPIGRRNITLSPKYGTPAILRERIGV